MIEIPYLGFFNNCSQHFIVTDPTPNTTRIGTRRIILLLIISNRCWWIIIPRCWIGFTCQMMQCVTTDFYQLLTRWLIDRIKHIWIGTKQQYSNIQVYLGMEHLPWINIGQSRISCSRGWNKHIAGGWW